ncbi:hypothetical protein Dimus_010766, partial [Dionaea muscipula]
KEVAKSHVHGVDIELDGISLATILGIPGNYGLCDYVKEVWEETNYCKPLEITRKFSNDETITKAGRVKSTAMKLSQRLLHIFVMKNMLPRFGKRDIASFMDLTFMEYLIARLLVNLPRLMIRHMAYVIRVPHHELPYGELLTTVFEAFEVPLNDKEGDEPVKTDFYDETFMNMCQLRREDGVWWLGTGANRRRDDIENEKVNEEEIPAKLVEVEDEEEGTPENEQVEDDAEVEGEPMETEAEVEESGSEDKYFDAVDEERFVDKGVTAPTAQPVKRKGKSITTGVDPSRRLRDYDLLHLNANFARALQANTRFQELL